MIGKWLSKEKKLGAAQKKRRYDIPLEKGAGGKFLTLLVALMTVLGMIALSGTFSLSAMKDRWTAGLENQITIEIPAQDKTGNVLKSPALYDIANRIQDDIANMPSITDIKILSEQEIKNLVEPWLGNESLLGQIPLPVLMSVKLSIPGDEDIHAQTQILQKRIQQIAPQARIDTHEEWLNDLVKFTGALRLAALLLTFFIGLTIIIAIAGAIRSRMAEYNKEVELLHLMGAPDNYIARQFQNHTLRICFKGAILGLLIGAITLQITGWLYGQLQLNLLPDFSLNRFHILLLASLPVLIALLALVTARKTVLKILKNQV